MLCIHHTTLEKPAYQPIKKRIRAQGCTRNARKHACGNTTTTVSPQSPVTQVQHNGPVRLSEHIQWNEIVVRSRNTHGVQLTDCVRDEFDPSIFLKKMCFFFPLSPLSPKMPLLAFLLGLNKRSFLRSRCSMEIWCPDDIRRESCQSGGGSAPLQILLFLFGTQFDVCVCALHTGDATTVTETD